MVLLVFAHEFSGEGDKWQHIRLRKNLSCVEGNQRCCAEKSFLMAFHDDFELAWDISLQTCSSSPPLHALFVVLFTIRLYFDPRVQD